MNEKLSVRLDREALAWADWNAEHPDSQSPTTEALLLEAAELARRVERAAEAHVNAGFGRDAGLIFAPAVLIDKRVRLLPEVES